jgi:hypothetical protein
MSDFTADEIKLIKEPSAQLSKSRNDPQGLQSLLSGFLG